MVNAWNRLDVSDKYAAVVPGRARYAGAYKNIAHFPEVPAHIGLTGKEKEDTESHKIGELYEFSNESSLD